MSVEPAGASAGTTHCFSQHGTGCISCRRAASVVATLTPMRLLDDILKCYAVRQLEEGKAGGRHSDALSGRATPARVTTIERHRNVATTISNMPRRVPASGRKHKTKLQVKRAIKRGDVPSPAILAASSTLTKGKNRRPGPGRSLQFGNTEERQENARRLQSSFVKLSAEFLEETRVKAATLPLPRPIPLENAYYQSQSLQSPTGKLTILGRPKWNYEMNKKQVESNEEGLFKRWIEETDQILQDWTASHNAPKETRSSEDVGSESVHEAPVEGESSLADAKMPIAPPQYERNLEVWRQL